MKLKALLVGLLLTAAVAVPARADGAPWWKRDRQLTAGFALGKGFVARSDSEIAALQYRVEFRKRRTYLALRGSWVAQDCNSRPNPTETALLAGISLPFDSGRNRIHLGLGAALTAAHGHNAVAGLPCEFRIKFGVFGISAFANFNRWHVFHGICASLDFTLPVFRD